MMIDKFGSIRRPSVTDLDSLVIDHVASYLNDTSLYRWVCAFRGHSEESLSPEWFFQQSMSSPDDFEIIPLDEDARECFYLAETFPQMRKCSFIPKFCPTNSSLGIHSLAQLLDVDPNSVYVERVAMLMGRLLYLAHAQADERYKHVLLWDVIFAARIFGFSSVPDHDQMFQFETHHYDFHVYLTAEECCTFNDTGEAFLFDTESIDSIRDQMRRFVGELIMDQEDFTDWLLDSHDNIELPTVPMDTDDNIDIESWLMALSSIDGDEQFFGCYESIKREYDTRLENLKTFHSDLNDYAYVDLGICMKPLQMSSFSTRLSPVELKRFIREFETTGDREYTNSALKFIHLIIEDLHFGTAVEVKVIKSGMFGIKWDYGFFFGENGTSWSSLVISDDVSMTSEYDDDSDFNLSDDE